MTRPDSIAMSVGGLTLDPATKAPIVVLRVSERPTGGPFAQTAGAVRSLADCGFRAVIDTLPDSLEPGTLATLRQDVIELGPMTRALLISLPEHAALHVAAGAL